MTGTEIVALFEQERATIAQAEVDRVKKQIEELKRDGKADMAAAIRVPTVEEIRFKLGKRKARKPTHSRIYEAQNALLDVMRAFPEMKPELIVRAVSSHVKMEPIVIARLWGSARERFEQSRT